MVMSLYLSCTDSISQLWVFCSVYLRNMSEIPTRDLMQQSLPTKTFPSKLSMEFGLHGADSVVFSSATTWVSVAVGGLWTTDKSPTNKLNEPKMAKKSLKPQQFNSAIVVKGAEVDPTPLPKLMMPNANPLCYSNKTIVVVKWLQLRKANTYLVKVIIDRNNC